MEIIRSLESFLRGRVHNKELQIPRISRRVHCIYVDNEEKAHCIVR